MADFRHSHSPDGRNATYFLVTVSHQALPAGDRQLLIQIPKSSLTPPFSPSSPDTGLLTRAPLMCLPRGSFGCLVLTSAAGALPGFWSLGRMPCHSCQGLDLLSPAQLPRRLRPPAHPGLPLCEAAPRPPAWAAPLCYWAAGHPEEHEAPKGAPPAPGRRWASRSCVCDCPKPQSCLEPR